MVCLAERKESIFYATFSMFQHILSPLQFTSQLVIVLYYKMQ